MNAKRANMIPITDYLEAKSIRPAKKAKCYSMYRAPYREDKTASLKVSHQENLWIDYGEENHGGTLIDLVLRINSSFNVSEAIKDILQTTKLFFSFHQQNKPIETRNEILQVSKPAEPDTKTEKPKAKIAFGTSSLQIANSNQQSAKQIIAKKYSGYQEKGIANICTINSYYLKDIGCNPAIVDYLNQRGISQQTAKAFCKEIYYQINGKTYFGLANKNNNGWSIRNKYWKGCTAQGYSYYASGSKELLVFEGIFDFLSLLELKCENKAKADILILNSLVNIKKSIPILQGYQSIEQYLDHDDAGRKATHFINKQYPNAEDASKFYSSHKDLNEYHLTKVKGKMVNEEEQLKKENQ